MFYIKDKSYDGGRKCNSEAGRRFNQEVMSDSVTVIDGTKYNYNNNQ